MPVRSRRRLQPDLYTVLLVISLIAVSLAVTFLWLAMKSYDYKIRAPQPPAPAVPRVTSVFDMPPLHCVTLRS